MLEPKRNLILDMLKEPDIRVKMLEEMDFRHARSRTLGLRSRTLRLKHTRSRILDMLEEPDIRVRVGVGVWVRDIDMVDL